MDKELLKFLLFVMIAMFLAWLGLVAIIRWVRDTIKDRFNENAEKHRLANPTQEDLNLCGRKEKERQAVAEKEKSRQVAIVKQRIHALAFEKATKLVEDMKAAAPPVPTFVLPPEKTMPAPEELPNRFPKVIPVEELDIVFANEEVLPDYSMPNKWDKMVEQESATTIDELKSVAEVLKNKEATTGEQQREAVRVIAKIDNTLLFEQMLTQIDGATKYASNLIEKHYTEQSTPYPKPQMVDFDMGKYLNY